MFFEVLEMQVTLNEWHRVSREKMQDIKLDKMGVNNL